MPLPDEKPRQSVANLIGRFEQQHKRQSLPGTPAVVLRQPVSAAKEESKGKKEWPPKSVASTDAKSVFTPTSPSSGPSKPSAPSPKTTVDIPVDPAATPSPESAQSAPPGGKATMTGTSTPTPGAKRAPLSPLKSRSSTASNLPVKSSVKPHPPKTSLSSAISQPLKPQHTGQSVVSNVSVPRTPRATPKAVTSTPSRPKTPATHSQGISRPKTPSSGLFAPTAASLARSRIAQPPLPPPVKKMTLSNSGATERLSKPTAASLSKARTPVLTSPPRVVKSISTGGTLRGPSKLKAGLSPDSAKEAKAKEMAKTTAPQIRGDDPAASEPAQNDHTEEAVLSDVDVVEDVHSHADVSPKGVHDQPPIVPEDGVSEEAEAHAISEPPHEMPDVPGPRQEDPSPEPPAVQDPVEEEVQEEVTNDVQPHEEDVSANGDGHPADVPIAPTAGSDIEDIVNLLEATSLSKSRPQSMITIPDEHEDTSDES
ncbi:hypothetical protein V8B97DRAFT_1948730 [Scleroderma yunnanense]